MTLANDSILDKASPAMLTRVDWQETSGVDHPANQEEGWLVLKNAEEQVVTEFENILKAEAAKVEVAEKLLTALSAVDFGAEPYSGAADEVKVAVKTVTGWLKSEGFGETKKDADADAEKESTEKAENIPAEGSAEKAQDDNVTIPKKKLMQALQEAVRSVFSSKKTVEKAEENEELLKAIAENWSGFLSTVKEVLTSTTLTKVEKKRQVEDLCYELASAVRQTPSWNIGK